MEVRNTNDERRSRTIAVIRNSRDECDLKISLFVSAVLSGKPEMCMKPFPSQYLDRQTKEQQLDELQQDLMEIPPVSVLDTVIEENQLSARICDLLYWLLVQCTKGVKRITRIEDLHPFLGSSLGKEPVHQRPQYIFEVVSNGQSHREKRFQMLREACNGIEAQYAYHGSRLESFFSILNHGLAQHLCKRDLYGEGSYLSTELSISLNFSQQGLAWTKSRYEENLSCVALCQYIPDPQFIRHNPKKIPPSYIVLTNNDAVQVRYLLIFAKHRRMHAARWANSFKNHFLWRHKNIVIVISYVLFMAAIGFFYNSRQL